MAKNLGLMNLMPSPRDPLLFSGLIPIVLNRVQTFTPLQSGCKMLPF